MIVTKEMIDSRIKQWRAWRTLVKCNPDRYVIKNRYPGNFGFQCVLIDLHDGTRFSELDRQEFLIKSDGAWA